MIRVTIVGAGHYARSIVARKYAECPDCSLVGVISPRAPAERLHGTPLAGLPLVRTAGEWLSLHGPPGEGDVFDLCVHPDAILPAMRPLVGIGAVAFVLPKPPATTRAELDAILGFVRSGGLRVAVASQWHFSRVTAALRNAVAGLAAPLRVDANFSQSFSPEQLRFYTPYTALLPHMLQILHTAGLWQPRAADHISRHDSPTQLLAEISTAGPAAHIALMTNLVAPERTRRFTVTDAAGRRVDADFLGVFHDGVAAKYPAVEIDGHREEIVEDNIAVMVRQEIAGFLDGASYLDLDGYLPVNEMLLTLRG